MRKWPNRLGKLASATLLSMDSKTEEVDNIHYNDPRRPHGIPTTLVDPAVAGGGGGVAGEHPFAFRSVSKDVDARGSHFGAARQARTHVLGRVRRERPVPRAKPDQIRRRGPGPGGQPAIGDGGRLRYGFAVRYPDFDSRGASAARADRHAVVRRSRCFGRIAARPRA